MAGSTEERVRRASSALGSEAVRAMEDLPWFAALPAEHRASVGLVVHAGVDAFAEWLRAPDRPRDALAPEVFAAAPRALTRSISLKQTVQLIRVAVGVVERAVPRLAAPGDEARLAEGVLRWSREIAFAAADVYAATAEARGAWDARLEAGVVEALVRGSVGERSLSRAASLGWRRTAWVCALATSAPRDPADADLGRLRTAASDGALSLLTGEAHGGLLLVAGGAGDRPRLDGLVDALPPGPVVVGPVVPDLAAAPTTVAEALAGLTAVPAWPDAPRPVHAGALLAERVVLGDPTARGRLLEEVYRPLVAAGGDLLPTVAAFLEAGSSVEASGRALVVHANTVRYRLRKVVDLVGLDLSTPRDAQVARVALVLGRTDTA